MTEAQELAEFEKFGEKIGALVRAKIIEECARIAERSARGSSYEDKICAQHIAARIRGSL